MKVKTSELTGAALDYATAKAQGLEVSVSESRGGTYVVRHADMSGVYIPSTAWTQGGPILHAMVWSGFELTPSIVGFRMANVTDEGLPRQNWDGPIVEEVGPKPLVAVCRAIVAAHLGDEVDVPDELVEGANHDTAQ
jgi:hypothetical protein